MTDDRPEHPEHCQYICPSCRQHSMFDCDLARGYEICDLCRWSIDRVIALERGIQVGHWFIFSEEERPLDPRYTAAYHRDHRPVFDDYCSRCHAHSRTYYEALRGQQICYSCMLQVDLEIAEERGMHPEDSFFIFTPYTRPRDCRYTRTYYETTTSQ